MIKLILLINKLYLVINKNYPLNFIKFLVRKIT